MTSKSKAAVRYCPVADGGMLRNAGGEAPNNSSSDLPQEREKRTLDWNGKLRHPRNAERMTLILIILRKQQFSICGRNDRYCLAHQRYLPSEG